MSLARGKYGIEYNPRQVDDDSSGLGWVIAAVLLLVFVSLGWTLIGRFRAAAREREVAASAEPVVSAEPSPSGTEASLPPLPDSPPTADQSTLMKRPVRVRNLLMRLKEAEKTQDIEMAVSTIEILRGLAGAPAADLDDQLARRLGDLNLRRLYVHRNAQWVTTVKAKRNDSARRIAFEHGSTVASLVKLNGGLGSRLEAGRMVYVMNHPRFSLIVHRRLRTVDLWLNGKFFRRYDFIPGDVTASLGQYELPERPLPFWNKLGIRFSERDRQEIETLLPPRTTVLVSEM